jgi:hypothetical protein
MPDITMCTGEESSRKCPHREQCYRFTAKPSKHRQSYFARLPLKGDETCESLWPLEAEKITGGR